MLEKSVRYKKIEQTHTKSQRLPSRKPEKVSKRKPLNEWREKGHSQDEYGGICDADVGGFLGVQDQSGLEMEFQDSQVYIDRPCHKKQKANKNKIQ